MRCADCGLYECVLRSPLGGCPNGEAVGQTVIFTAPDTKPSNLGNGQWDKGYEPAAVPEERNVKIAKTWQDLFLQIILTGNGKLLLTVPIPSLAEYFGFGVLNLLRIKMKWNNLYQD